MTVYAIDYVLGHLRRTLVVQAEDADDAGASHFPEGTLRDESIMYRISYNGRIWRGTTPVYP